MDFLVIQMDGDVSRKDKPSHCGCASNVNPCKDEQDYLYCDTSKCPIQLPCNIHGVPALGYQDHLKELIRSELIDMRDTCIVIPCDSTEAWIVAAYGSLPNAELLNGPWENVIANGKAYHGIRIPGSKKCDRIFKEFAPIICEQWSKVTQICQSAMDFGRDVHNFI